MKQTAKGTAFTGYHLGIPPTSPGHPHKARRILFWTYFQDKLYHISSATVIQFCAIWGSLPNTISAFPWHHSPLVFVQLRPGHNLRGDRVARALAITLSGNSVCLRLLVLIGCSSRSVYSCDSTFNSGAKLMPDKLYEKIKPLVRICFVCT